MQSQRHLQTATTSAKPNAVSDGVTTNFNILSSRMNSSYTLSNRDNKIIFKKKRALGVDLKNESSSSHPKKTKAEALAHTTDIESTDIIIPEPEPLDSSSHIVEDNIETDVLANESVNTSKNSDVIIPDYLWFDSLKEFGDTTQSFRTDEDNKNHSFSDAMQNHFFRGPLSLSGFSYKMNDVDEDIFIKFSTKESCQTFRFINTENGLAFLTFDIKKHADESEIIIKNVIKINFNPFNRKLKKNAEQAIEGLASEFMQAVFPRYHYRNDSIEIPMISHPAKTNQTRKSSPTITNENATRKDFEMCVSKYAGTNNGLRFIFNKGKALADSGYYKYNFDNPTDAHPSCSLTLILRKLPNYKSYFWSEMDLRNAHYPENNEPLKNFHKLEVRENVEITEMYRDKPYKSTKMNSIITIIAAHDYAVSELHKIDKGIALSGNEVLRLALYLMDDLLQVKTSYLQDDSKIKLENNKIIGYVPLRISLTLGNENPKTYYERFGYTPYAFTKVKNGWDDNLESYMAQDPEKYIASINALKTLTLQTLHDFLPLDLRLILLALIKNNCDELSLLSNLTLDASTANIHSKLTLQHLIHVVYGISIKKNNPEEVEKLNTLLNLPKYLEERKHFENNDPRAQKYQFKNSDGFISSANTERDANEINVEQPTITVKEKTISSHEAYTAHTRQLFFFRFFQRSRPLKETNQNSEITNNSVSLSRTL